MKKTKNIGIEIAQPKETCEDQHCPFHSNHKIRGRTFNGKIIKLSSAKTAIIEIKRLYLLPKYERFEKRRTKLKVHVPPCIKLNQGDLIKIVESKPISKTKNFVAVGKVKEQ